MIYLEELHSPKEVGKKSENNSHRLDPAIPFLEI
jgi:hypothetical protein